MTQQKDFVHLHLHTDYSLLDGAIQIKPLADRLKQLNMKACAITDHGNIFGAISFYKELKAKELKPIIGSEVYYTRGARGDRTSPGPGEKPYNHMILLAKDREGYHNLVRLTSKAFKEGMYYKPRIDKELLSKYSKGLICLSACLSGVPQYFLKKDKFDEAARSALEFQDIFGPGNYFLEIQDHKLDDQKKIEKGLFELSKKTGIPLVATNDAHYLTKEDHIAHDVMLCIAQGKTINDKSRWSFGGPEFYVRSPEEMWTIFSETPDVLTRTMEIAEMCDLKIPLGENQLPVFPIPASEGDITVDEYFEKQVWLGYKKRKATVLDQMQAQGTLRHTFEEYERRIAHEIGIIKQMGFPSYFLIVWDFIKYAKDRNIPVGPGRGSASGSMAAYCLEITDVDPLQYNLLFERFLNPERVSMPDIDVDFCVHGRAEVINHVTELYGRDSVCQIITFGTMASKAAVKDVGRALDMPYPEVEKIAKMIPPPVRGRNVSIAQAIEQVPELKKERDTNPKIAELLEIAQRLEGCARHSSVHAAGVVISPKPLEELVPIAVSSKSELTTQYEMSDLEKTGMLKMDFLGLTTLTIINECLRTMRETLGVEIDWSKVSLEDEKVYQLFAEGRLDAVFQFESDGMKEICRRLRPRTLEDLSALNALYRPGPLDSGMIDDYIERHHGRRPVEYLVPEMEDILSNTYGICVTGDTLVWDSTTGERMRIDELENRVGNFYVQGVDAELKLRRARMTHFVCNGRRKVVLLKLRNGASVKLTPNHQVLTENGWREVGKLKAGDYIATPRHLFVEEEREYDRQKLRVLAYLIADGSLSSVSCTADFVSKDEGLLAEYQRCLGAFERVAPRTLQQVRGVTRVMTKGINKLYYHEPNSLVLFLRELNLKSKRGGCRSDEKFVPEFVFGLTSECVAFFVASLWDCDGYIGESLCHYKTISPQLAHDVQTLLLRLGIYSTIYESHYHSERRSGEVTAYQVTTYDLKAFHELIAPHLVSKKMCCNRVGKDKTCDTVSRSIFLEELSRAWSSSGRALMQEYRFDRQHLLPKGKNRPRIGVSVVSNLAHTLSLQNTIRHLNVRWEEIVEIVPSGVETVYDITVEDIHNFVGNNIILHNCVYQEQIMQLTQKLAGYSLGEADLMRRAMGKKNREEMAVHEKKFIDGATKNKIPKKKAQEIFRLMANFADYGFNRCLTGDAKIVDADTHEIVTIEQIANRKVNTKRTFSFNGEQVIFNEIIEAFETGEKEVVEVETADGRTICCTLDHKFYTDEGYLPLHEILERDLEIYVSPGVDEYAANSFEGSLKDKHLSMTRATIPRSGRQSKAPCEAQRSAGLALVNEIKPAYAGDRYAIDTLSPVARALSSDKPTYPAFRFAPHWALLCRPLRGLTDADFNRTYLHSVNESLTVEKTKIVRVTPCAVEKTYNMTMRGPNHNYFANGILTANSHSIAYSVVAFQTAYLKAHYPAHFYAAVLTNEADNTDKVLKYTAEARSQGIAILPPDINESNSGFTPVDGAIRFGLSAIKGLGHSAVQAMLDARGSTPFTSLFDFADRVSSKGINKRVLESLISAGALDSMNRDNLSVHEWRARLFASIDRALDHGARSQRERDLGQSNMFAMMAGGDDASLAPEPELPKAKAWTHTELLAAEKTSLGFYISGHPLEDHANALRSLGVQAVSNLVDLPNGARVKVGGLVTDYVQRFTKRNTAYALFRLEDIEGAQVKCVMWSEVLSKCASFIGNDALVYLVGKLDAPSEGVVSIIVDEAQQLEGASAKQARALLVTLRNGPDTESINLELVRDALHKHVGTCPVHFKIHLPDLNVAVRVETSPAFWIKPDKNLEAALKNLGCEVEWLTVTPQANGGNGYD